MRRLWAGAGCMGIAAATAACTKSTPKGFDELAPEGRIEAIVDAARAGDQRAIPDLIGGLDSDDGAIRMLSIRTLERLTGQTLGYDHAAPEWRRREAVERWMAWAGDRGVGQSGGGS